MGRNWTSRDFLRGLRVFQETRRGWQRRHTSIPQPTFRSHPRRGSCV